MFPSASGFGGGTRNGLSYLPASPRLPLSASAAAAPQSTGNADVDAENDADAENPSGPAEDLSDSSVVGSKEKTPMCLINELARFNKIQHQYRLIDEDGPAHKKTFSVVLRLGSEEYTSSGPSIKKAQHAAASLALTKTQFKHPPPKAKRCNSHSNHVTPTVELNALAMKRGEPTEYRVIQPSRGPPPFLRPPYSSSFGSPRYVRYRGLGRGFDSGGSPFPYRGYPQPTLVLLRVGSHEFIGEGAHVQEARHNAAAKAIKRLQELPLPPTDENPASPPAAAASTDTEIKTEEAVEPKAEDSDEVDDELKSPISLVHEIALKRGLSVNFEVVRESGPPHMRIFVTRCIVGDFTTEGEGNGKKISKKRSAEKMLQELRLLPPVPIIVNKTKRNKTTVAKKKSRNLIKEQKMNGENCTGVNPVSRLIQIQQAKREKEPEYRLIDERGVPRRREFLMQVTVGNRSATGSGSNKKVAKRNAAEALLQVMGYSRPPCTPSDGSSSAAAVRPEAEGEKIHKSSYFSQNGGDSEPEAGKSDGHYGSGRQLVPGILQLPDASRDSGEPSPTQGVLSNSSDGGSPSKPDVPKHSIQLISTIAKELLEFGHSPTASALRKTDTTLLSRQRQKQLQYLADALSIKVQFTDFPKGNKREFISLVSLSTTPPQVSHGAGDTVEESHEQAALKALQALANISSSRITATSVTDVAPDSPKP